jgi:hypothetical protein
MNIGLLLLGILLTLIAFMEGLWTTIWVDGNSAPLTSRLTTWIWKGMRAMINSKKHKALSLAGPLILFTTVLMWIVLLWFGWTFIFFADKDSLNIEIDDPALDFTDVMWYIAYCMFTIGNGDFTPNGGIWQVLSSFVGMSGMLVVTLSVTYVLQVVSAVANKRSFASQVTGIGKTSEDFVLMQWNGKGFGAIELQLNSLSQQLATLNEQHMSFPILHYYHAAKHEKSQDIAVAVLDDALTLIEHGVEEAYHPATTILSASRKSIDSFLQTMQSAFIEAAPSTPKPPDLSKLTDKGIPTVSEQEFHRRLAENTTERRKLLLGLTTNGAWEWPS